MAIKEQFLSYFLFNPKGRKSDIHADEYGLEKLKAVDSNQEIYYGTKVSAIRDELSRIEREFRIYKYRSVYQIPITVSFNRGYKVENYFLREIVRSTFNTKSIKKAQAFLVPATPYMYYTLVQIWWKILQFFGVQKRNSKDTDYDFSEKRKLEEKLLIAALKNVIKSDSFKQNKGANHIYFSSILGTEFIEHVNRDLFSNGILAVNSADKRGGHFNFQKDVSTVCMQDYKIPKFAYDIGAFDEPYQSRKFYTYYAGMFYGHRRYMFKYKTEDCYWIDGHIGFENYLRNYANAKFYFHFPGRYEWSPRLFEGMYFGAVPVILYDNYSLPFSDFIDWDKFSIRIHMDQMDDTYEILKGVTEEKWNEKRRHLRAVLKHFCYHKTPIFGDAFYMTIYSIYRRLGSQKDMKNGFEA